jgi:type II secretory pathway pseudopilin PulG
MNKNKGIYPPPQKTTGTSPWMNVAGILSEAIAESKDPGASADSAAPRRFRQRRNARCHGRKPVGLHKKTKQPDLLAPPDQRSAGFTMIEVLVAFTLFLVVVGATSGVFLAAVRSQRNSTAFLNAQNNLRFVLESTSREIRTGRDFQILKTDGPSLRGGMGQGENGDVLSFTNQNGDSVRYRLQAGKLEKSSDSGVSFSALTAENVTVASFRFYLAGAAPADELQPRITLSVKVRSRVGTQEQEVLVQTTVTQREIDG